MLSVRPSSFRTLIRDQAPRLSLSNFRPSTCQKAPSRSPSQILFPPAPRRSFHTTDPAQRWFFPDPSPPPPANSLGSTQSTNPEPPEPLIPGFVYPNLPPVAFSTSIANSGNPYDIPPEYYTRAPTTKTVSPPPVEPSEASEADEGNYDPSQLDLYPVAWSTSIATSGEPYFLFPPPDPSKKKAHPKRRDDEAEDTNHTPSEAHDFSSSNESFLSLSAGFPPSRVPAPEWTSTPEDATTMASDEDYAAFLEKADADRSGASKPKTQQHYTSGRELKAVTHKYVPPMLSKVEATYASEADEPFEAVALARKDSSKGRVTKAEFCSLVGVDDAEEMTLRRFDPRQQYSSILGAVANEVDGGNEGTSVYRVETGGARCEYWVIGRAKRQEDEIVGLRAKAVES